MPETTRKAEFERFYNENFDKIYRFVVFRVSQDHELAEDLVSEIFMKALQNFDCFDEKISHSAWVFTIAKNHLANHWRDRKPVSSLPEIDEEGQEEGAWVEKSLRNFGESRLKLEVTDYLAVLSPGEQEIVTFHYIQGYSYSEIASMRDMSETAVKVCAHRAIKKMRQTIENI